jgi:phenylalanyl-tRNA synthetase alpha chain
MEPDEARRVLDEVRATARSLIGSAGTIEELDAARVALLGRKAAWAKVQRSIGTLPEADRREVGRLTNEVRAELDRAIADRRAVIEPSRDTTLDEGKAVDVTLPGRRQRPGSLHPLSVVEDRMVEVFTRMGYRVVEGPEIEDEWHNFEALNIPADHPARTMKDSLYVDVPEMLLRTETSAVQIRTMESQRPPVYVIVPGRVYRREAVDATHLSVFHQLECLAVDEGISLADLKGTLEAFAHEMFGPDIHARITPDYFPFVEPGAQMAVTCFVCGGVGCRVCGNGWLEQGGAGMVHPKVLENCGYDAERYTGFAFGLGIERVAMVRYGIDDMRLLVEGDVRFLEQFQGAAA